MMMETLNFCRKDEAARSSDLPDIVPRGEQAAAAVVSGAPLDCGKLGTEKSSWRDGKGRTLYAIDVVVVVIGQGIARKWRLSKGKRNETVARARAMLRVLGRTW